MTTELLRKPMTAPKTEQSSTTCTNMEEQSRFTRHLRKARLRKKHEGEKAKQLASERRANLVKKRSTLKN